MYIDNYTYVHTCMHYIHVQVDNPQSEGVRLKWKHLFTQKKRKAVLDCFLAVPYFQIRK